jgi:hypothetical protein
MWERRQAGQTAASSSSLSPPNVMLGCHTSCCDGVDRLRFERSPKAIREPGYSATLVSHSPLSNKPLSGFQSRAFWVALSPNRSCRVLSGNISTPPMRARNDHKNSDRLAQGYFSDNPRPRKPSTPRDESHRTNHLSYHFSCVVFSHTIGILH